MNRISLPMRGRRAGSQRGFSLIELLIVIAIILIILSIALPQMSKSQMQSREMAAVATLRTVNTEEVQYESQFGQYATSLSQLGPPAAGAAEGPQAAGLIPPNLASGESSGYKFAITQTPQGYAATAVPRTFNTTGRRSFYTDQTNTIRQNWGQDPATVNSPEIK
ncbi:MAG: prepilin-type N-terminal cleavage/methylation domain-containing protein [Bryobacteraceae bacterium]